MQTNVLVNVMKKILLAQREINSAYTSWLSRHLAPWPWERFCVMSTDKVAGKWQAGVGRKEGGANCVRACVCGWMMVGCDGRE